MEYSKHNLEHLILMSTVDLESRGIQLNKICIKIGRKLLRQNIELSHDSLVKYIDDISNKIMTIYACGHQKIAIKASGSLSTNIVDSIDIIGMEN